MATSLASQLQTIKSFVQADSEPQKGPITRPSVLYDPRKAADIDNDTIFSLALSGLEVLFSMEERFGNYRNDLFSYKNKELDRELKGIEENKKIDASIKSYLRLLTGYLESHSALKTLEYLIRRYKIHVYNQEELILCVLPYHDTHMFVRIVQLIDTGNSKWKFLEGVKASGAPPPRNVIVQQCIRDMGVLETLCNYAKEIKSSMLATRFCTAVVVEVIGSLTTIDNDVVRRILPYVFSGLQSGDRGRADQKAGSLMIVSLLADKADLSSNLVKRLSHSLAEIARADAKESNDLNWSRMSFVALVNLFQLQSIDIFPKKTLDILKEIRNISDIFSGMTKEFNIDNFLSVFLDSLIEYSFNDFPCHQTLLSILDTVPLKGFVNRIISKLFKSCMKLSNNNTSGDSGSGSRAKETLVTLYKRYPFELRGAVHKFLEDQQVQSKKTGINYEALCRTFDGNFDLSVPLSDSKVWLELEHPKAEVRRSTLTGLDVDGILKEKAARGQSFDSIQDAILRRLRDDELTVVQAALNMERLSDIISSPLLFDALLIVLHRCIRVLKSSSSDNSSVAVDVAVSCLQHVMTSLQDQEKFTKIVATSIFPLILILPKTKRLNLKVLEMAKEINWPFYENLAKLSLPKKKLDNECMSSINLESVEGLAETFSRNPEDFLSWLLECCDVSESSKTLLLLVLLQSFLLTKTDAIRFSAMMDTCFPLLKNEWGLCEAAGNLAFAEECNERLLDGDYKMFHQQLLDTNVTDLNAGILTCLFWRLVESLVGITHEDMAVDKEKLANMVHDLFVFFASQSKKFFKKHLHHLVTKCRIAVSHFLSKLFTDQGTSAVIQVESLNSFAVLCSHSEESLCLQLLAEFPSILVPLSSESQDVRIAAMSCIECLLTLWSRVNSSGSKNGQNPIWINFLGDLLALMVQLKRMILSDKNVLPSFFTSLLGSSSNSLLVHQNVGNRFNQSAKDDILVFIFGCALRLSAYAKLKILSLIKGVGSEVIRVAEIRSLLHGLLSDLLKKRRQYHLRNDKSSEGLLKVEVDILCLLLEICTIPATLTYGGHDFEYSILEALEISGGSSKDFPIAEPCITILRNLSISCFESLKTETQEHVLCDLVHLFRSANADIQNVCRETLQRLNLKSSTVVRILHSIMEQNDYKPGLAQGNKKKKAKKHANLHLAQIRDDENFLVFVSSLLDVLLLKKNMEDRASLIDPLFKILRIIIGGDQLNKSSNQNVQQRRVSYDISKTISGSAVYVEQALLLILEDILNASAASDNPQMGGIITKFDLELLIQCARSATDAVTRNHIFSLLATIAKVTPDRVMDHIVDILTVIGESAVMQWDSYSKRVFEGLISAVVPCWLSQADNTDKLLEIFVDILPQLAEHQRLPIIIHLLRNLEESVGLGCLLFLLFRSLISRKSLLNVKDGILSLDQLISVISTQWECTFAMQLAEQYSCTVWLPSMVVLIQRVGKETWSEGLFIELLVSVHFISSKLQDPEVAFMLDSGENLDYIQSTLGTLLEQVVCHLQMVDSKRKQINFPSSVKKELKEYMHSVVLAVSSWLNPSEYFKVIIQLLGHANKHIIKKALGFLCELVKGLSNHNGKDSGKGLNLRSGNSWRHFDEASLESFRKMCTEILSLINNSDEESGTSMKLAAVSAIEVLAINFPSDDSVFDLCLQSACKNISVDNSAVSSHCLRATGALINVLGPKALPELPSIMQHILEKARSIMPGMDGIERSNGITSIRSENSDNSVYMHILVALEAVIDRLGGFLNPYLGSILELLVLYSQYVSSSTPKLKLKADVVRKLLVDRTPVRLLLPPLLKIYSDAIGHGESSLSVVFEMLRNLVHLMDRSSIGAHHGKIFDLCLLALDLRRQQPASVLNIDFVEKNIINAMVGLTLKLTESMFRPLFIRSIEWSGSIVEEGNFAGGKAIDRAISFYGLVNKLAESHRSLFVPYFKYLLDGCVRHLSDSEDTNAAPTQKKKPKLQEESSRKKDRDSASLGIWHLRALILSSLHKCFLYDTGSPKFLDSSNFQVLLKPVVSQLVLDPPASLEENPNVPSLKEVDDLMVECIGQMAVAAGSDLLWKSLNHEVLMQTRSDKVRSRILALRVVKCFAEKLKEEYLVLLAETIPFLGELLEDVEMPVKSLAREILKELESMSGESLRQYL